MSELKREIKFINRLGRVDCKFYLKGEKGIIQFCINTGWDDQTNDGIKPNTYAYDVGYHSPVPIHDGQKPMVSCEFYDTCYYDGSSMYAHEVFKKLIHFGEEAVWFELEKAYKNWLDKSGSD